MPSLSSFCAVEKPLHALLDQERGNALRPGLRIGLRVDDERVGVRPVGDPHLGAVEDVAIALAVGAQPHRHDIGPGTGLAHRERADVLAADELRQVFAFLRVAAVAADLVHAQVRVRAIGQPDRRRRARDLLHRHAMREIAHRGAAVLLLDGDAEQTQVAHLAPQVGRELVRVIDVRGARRDLVRGELLHRRAQQIDRLAMMKGQRWKVEHRPLQCSSRS